MRRVGGPVPGLIVPFVPRAFGNDRDPQPIVVRFTAPTEAQRRALKRPESLGAFALDPVTGKAELDAAGRVKVVLAPTDRTAERKRAVLDHVTSVENYEGADGQPIDDAKRLWEHGETEIVTEVADAILDSAGLTEAEKKSSGASSG